MKLLISLSSSSLLMYHGSQTATIDWQHINLIFLTANRNIAQAYAEGTVAFAGVKRGSRVPSVYEVRVAPKKIFDLRQDRCRLDYAMLRKNNPDEELPSLKSEGFIQSHSGLPGYGNVRGMRDGLVHMGYDCMFVDEGSQGVSLAVFEPSIISKVNKLNIALSGGDDSDLGEHVGVYQDMFGDVTGAMKAIMSHPEAKRFSKPPSAKSVYRAISFTPKALKAYQKTGVYVQKKSHGFDGRKGKVLPYSLDPQIARNAVEDLELGDVVLVFKKPLVASAFALNFSALVEKSKLLSDYETSQAEEKEVWMYATPEYTTFNKSEEV